MTDVQGCRHEMQVIRKAGVSKGLARGSMMGREAGGQNAHAESQRDN